jgi:hypothetical protein
MIDEVNTIEDLKTKILLAAKEEREKADIRLGDDAVNVLIKKELKFVEDCILEANLDCALQLAPGKALLGQLLRFTGCRNSSAIIRSIRLNLNPENYSHLKELEDLLTKSFNQ